MGYGIAITIAGTVLAGWTITRPLPPSPALTLLGLALMVAGGMIVRSEMARREIERRRRRRRGYIDGRSIR